MARWSTIANLPQLWKAHVINLSRNINTKTLKTCNRKTLHIHFVVK